MAAINRIPDSELVAQYRRDASYPERGMGGSKGSPLTASFVYRNYKICPSFNRPMELIKRLVILALTFGILNLILWGGQEIYHSGDRRQIKEIEILLDGEKREIANLEKKIEADEANLKQTNDKLNHLKSIGSIDEYNAGVDEFNLFLEWHRQDITNYKNRLAAYNVKVDEVNVLIQKSGSRFYIIPVPLPSKNVRSKL